MQEESKRSPRSVRQSGAGNSFWKGGRTLASNGYVLVKAPEHPLADVRGYVYEHRLVAEQKIGRPLASGEQIHHINHDKADNRPENLEVLSAAEHRRAHRTAGRALREPGESNPDIECRCECGSRFPKYDATGRPRMYVSGHNSQPTPKTVALCACGCGQNASPGREWRAGHHKRGRTNG